MSETTLGIQPPLAIIKADDVRRITEKWDRFFTMSREKGVKVSAGIICNSLEDPEEAYLAWLLNLQASGQVEFWNHGWDHLRWEDDDGNRYSEFNGSGYAHQKKHFEDAQRMMTEVFGKPSRTFGTPFNSVDEDTKRVLRERRDLQLFFSKPEFEFPELILAPMLLRGEAGGAGKPDADAFIEAYPSVPPAFTSIQFHPNSFQEEHFEEYSRILDFLLSLGWSFLLPSEYLKHNV